MFTGLIETIGIVYSLEKAGNGIRLSITPVSDFSVSKGESIAVNGVCLTVTQHNREMCFDVSPETLNSTTMGDVKARDRVNLERALRLSDRLGGHLVTGHVDGVGILRGRQPSGDYTFYTFESSREILKYVVSKGSVAIDGISLTIVEANNTSFRIAVIPHTLTATTLGDKKVGDMVNIETDIIGKYVEKFIAKQTTDSRFMDLLKDSGFVNE